jgi:NAD(P)-dependent dehydrogenase (short-subunit alcohol dehydrogenase family)
VKEGLADKVAIITGGASGIGRATARLLASKGALVVVADINEAGGRETVRLIEEGGGKARFVRADVTDTGQVEAMAQAAVETFGGLDILHANAGHPGPEKRLVDHTDKEWSQVLAVNLTGVFNCCRAAIPLIASRGGGAIVITASIAGLWPAPFIGAYNVSKAGVISLTKTLAIECAPLGIRVNAVAPGEVDTPMSNAAVSDCPEQVLAAQLPLIPLKRMGRAEEIAQAVLYLVSDASSYVAGEVLTVDGGMSAGWSSLMTQSQG